MTGRVYVGPWDPPAAPTLTVKLAAAAAGVSEKTVRRWLAAGLPHSRNGDGQPRIAYRELEAWASKSPTARMVRPTPSPPPTREDVLAARVRELEAQLAERDRDSNPPSAA